MNQQPTVLPHIKLVPHNGFFQIIDRDVLRTLKFGRTVRFFLLRSWLFPFFSQWPPLILQGEVAEADPDFIGFNSRVVSRRHAEIWAVNGEVCYFASLSFVGPE